MFKIKVGMEITVLKNEEEVLNIRKREFTYDIDKTNNFYLYRIRNFLSNRLNETESKIGKSIRDIWGNLMSTVDEVLTSRGADVSDIKSINSEL